MSNEKKEYDSLGERVVRVNFNPSQIDKVSEIKQKTAVIINMVNEIRNNLEGLDHNQQYDKDRLGMKAIEAYEEAAMWAVKAATV